MANDATQWQPATYLAIRFGYGFGPQPAPTSVDEALSRLSGPDIMAERFPFLDFGTARDLAVAYSSAQRARREKAADAEQQMKSARRDMRRTREAAVGRALSRIVESDDPFRERLTWFWADHLTARAKSVSMGAGGPAYIGDAIRPFVTGRFADMLKASATHPLMLVYLDQTSSIGPNSKRGRGKGRGLNENLAREILELHTLGVGAPYTQDDVRQFAELLTGLTFNRKQGVRFVPAIAEPGAETVLGEIYGGDAPSLDDIHQALEDLAVHPSTAEHLAQKLAAHFVSDTPDPDLVAHIAAAYQRSDGALMPVYEALLEHPAAFAGAGQKVKQPFDFIASSLTALGVTAAEIDGYEDRKLQRLVMNPLRRMSQPFLAPPGPDGWPDTEADWVTPQGLAERITWAMSAPRRLKPELPDPREFVTAALGEAAHPRLVFAAGAAETRDDGIGIVLASPDFNRR